MENRRWLFIIAVMIITASMSGCIFRSDENGTNDDIDDQEWTGPYLDDSEATDEGTSQIIEANNEFGMDLYKWLASEEDGNLFISPYSIFTALSMTYEGADGETAAEIKDVLHLPDDEDERRGSFAKVQNGINDESSDFDLSTANAIWPAMDHQFYQEFIDTIKQYYYGEVNELDYWNDPEGSRNTINEWASDETNGKIPELLPPGSIFPGVVMVLTNAIYFKGQWKYEFNEEDTYSGDFHIDPSTTVTADLMEMTCNLQYSQNEAVKMVELPYKGEELSMLLLLPNTNDISELEDDLDWEMISDLKEDLIEYEVEITMPKFEMELEFELKEALIDLGMPLAFGPADFSKMTEDGISIDEVYHDTFIEVNEEGTEAAAATAVVMKNSSSPDKTEFRADKPFLFLIQQRDTGNILFMGRVSDPSI